jgi:hypothetical protein
MATLLKVLNNLADTKSAGGVALHVRTQDAAILRAFSFEYTRRVAVTNIGIRNRFSVESIWMPRIVTSNV